MARRSKGLVATGKYGWPPMALAGHNAKNGVDADDVTAGLRSARRDRRDFFIVG